MKSVAIKWSDGVAVHRHSCVHLPAVSHIYSIPPIAHLIWTPNYLLSLRLVKLGAGTPHIIQCSDTLIPSPAPPAVRDHSYISIWFKTSKLAWAQDCRGVDALRRRLSQGLCVAGASIKAPALPAVAVSVPPPQKKSSPLTAVLLVSRRSSLDPHVSIVS